MTKLHEGEQCAHSWLFPLDDSYTFAMMDVTTHQRELICECSSSTRLSLVSLIPGEESDPGGPEDGIRAGS